jgi:transcriptional regulator GlxA family with amidase domain
MKTGILLTAGHRQLSAAALLDVLDTVNGFCGHPYFDIHLVADAPDAVLRYPDHKHSDIAAPGRYDLLLVPAFKREDVTGSLGANRHFAAFLKKQYEGGASVASFCTGAFLLGVAGLLDHKPATTHIDASRAFAQAFPKVRLEPDAVLTCENRVYTSGGATNTFHLLLHLVERYCGREMAVKTAKVFSVDLGRTRQGYFRTYMPDDSHGDDLVRMAQEKIRMHYGNAGSVDELLTEIPASRRNLARRFKQATGSTLIEYLQMIRIEAARRMLEQSGQSSVTDVMLESGYNDLKSFRTLFKKSVGMTPKAYREKFNGTRQTDGSEKLLAV